MTTESAVREAPVTRPTLTCRLCGSSELRSSLDLGATSPYCADVLTDLPLNDRVKRFTADPGKVGALLAEPPQSAFHCVDVADDDSVNSITTLQRMPLWENGGYFVLRPEIFDYIPEGGDLIADGCVELAKEGRMMAYEHRDPLQAAIAAINDAHRER